MFPAFSKLAGEEAGQVRARYYLTTLRYVSWITIPIAVATILFAREFILGLYGATWAPAIIPLQWLAVYGLIRSLAANMGSIFRGLGKPQWLTYIAVWRLSTMVLLLYPAIAWNGIVGVSILSVAVAVVDFVISATLVGRLVVAPWRAYVRMLLPTMTIALIAGFAADWAYPHIPLAKNLLRLTAAGGLMCMLYVGLAWLTDSQFRETGRRSVTTLRRLQAAQRETAAPEAPAP
jgi:O-antigen/teichoic acid export membrane protein